MENTVLWILRILYTFEEEADTFFVWRAKKGYIAALKCGIIFPVRNTKVYKHFPAKLHDFTQFRTLFRALMINFSNLKVYLIGLELVH